MARLPYAVTCMTLLFAISEGKTLFDVITFSPGDMKRLEYTEHNLPSIQNKEIALSVESCDEVTICFSQADVHVYQNMFAVTLGTRGISIKLGHTIQRLKQEHFVQHRIDMCRRSSVFILSWKENTMRIFKQCSTNIFTRKLPWAGTNYSIRFITVTSHTRAHWQYGDVCHGKHPTPPLPKNTGIKDLRTNRRIGYLSLTLKGINISPSFAFRVKGCGKLALALHKNHRVSSILTRYEIEIDNRAQSLKASIVKGTGSPFKRLEIISERRMGHRKWCSDFRIFRVKYSQNHLEFEGCDGMTVKLLNFSIPGLSPYRYMSAYSDKQADWTFGVEDSCKSNKGPVTSLFPKPNMACNRDTDCNNLLMKRCCRGGYCSKCSGRVSGTAGSVRSECSPKSGSSACTTNADNRPTESSSTDWRSISNKTTGPATAVAPYPLVTGTIDYVIDIEETTMPGPSTSASSSSSNSSSSNSSSSNSSSSNSPSGSSPSGNSSSSNASSGNSSLAAEQFQDGIEQISKALGSSGIGLAASTVSRLTLLVCICTFATYPL